MRNGKTRLSILFLLLVIGAPSNYGQSTAFNFQGDLKVGGIPANGNFDFEFALFDAAAAGNQAGNTIMVVGLAVTNGVFSVQLDFGSQFPGAARFLEIRARTAGGGAFTTLAPRQLIASIPYSIKAVTADTASNALQLGGVASSQYVLTTDARLSDARTPVPGDSSYIQNTTTQQTASNFNISGTGTADVLNAATQINLNNIRVLKNQGIGNIFVGENAGTATASSNNAFVGAAAGVQNSSGSSNAFVGAFSGQSNSTGKDNTFLGSLAGGLNTTGSNNTFVGRSAGNSNTIGTGNTVVGFEADVSGTLTNATAIGQRAQVGLSNSLVLGSISGINGASQTVNVGIGTTNPTNRLHVVGNGLFTGSMSVNGDVTVDGVLNATLPPGSPRYIQNSSTPVQTVANFNISGTGTADQFTARESFNINNLAVLRLGPGSGLNVGFGTAIAATGQGNTIVGNNAGLLATTGHSNVMVGYEAGRNTTTGFDNVFVGLRSGMSNNTGNANSFLGNESGRLNTTGASNALFGNGSGQNNTTGAGNTFIGAASGDTNVDGVNNTTLGAGSDVGSPDLNNATAIGSGAIVSTSNTIQLGRASALDTVHVPGKIRAMTLSTGGTTNLCRNTVSEIATCSSSIRYKMGISSFRSGTELIARLRPVTFYWKDGGMRDLGLVAEEVAAVEPLLTTTGANGEVEGVKYDRVALVLINAVVEQQDMLRSQAETIGKLQAEIDALLRQNIANETAIRKLTSQMIHLKQVSRNKQK